MTTTTEITRTLHIRGDNADYAVCGVSLYSEESLWTREHLATRENIFRAFTNANRCEKCKGRIVINEFPELSDVVFKANATGVLVPA